MIKHIAFAVPSRRLKFGFTLVEMLVVLAIMAMLLLAVTQLTADWVHGAHTSEAKSKLARSYEQAKALALRNPCSVDSAISHSPAATLKAEYASQSIRLTVLAGSAASTADNCPFLQARPNPQWQMDLPVGVTLQLQDTVLTNNQAAFLALDSRSWPLQDQALRYKLSKGSDSNDEVGTLK